MEAQPRLIEQDSKLNTEEKINFILNHPDLPSHKLAERIGDTEFFVRSVREARKREEFQPGVGRKYQWGEN